VHYGLENHSSFSVRLQVEPGAVATIRVATHQASSNDCELAKRGLD
jgi:hypothetical protein